MKDGKQYAIAAATLSQTHRGFDDGKTDPYPQQIQSLLDIMLGKWLKKTDVMTDLKFEAWMCLCFFLFFFKEQKIKL